MGTIIKTWRPIFKEKTSLLLVETVFLASEQFLPLFRYSWLWKQFFRQVETYFLTSSSFRLVKTDFLSSGKSFFFFIPNFPEVFEIWRCQFLLVETNLLIFWLVELIFPICEILLLVKAIFRFLNNLPIRMVEMHFLSCGNRFLLFNFFFYRWKLSLKLMQTHFFLFFGRKTKI